MNLEGAPLDKKASPEPGPEITDSGGEQPDKGPSSPSPEVGIVPTGQEIGGEMPPNIRDEDIEDFIRRQEKHNDEKPPTIH